MLHSSYTLSDVWCIEGRRVNFSEGNNGCSSQIIMEGSNSPNTLRCLFVLQTECLNNILK